MRKMGWRKIAMISALLAAALLILTIFTYVVPAEQHLVLDVFECRYVMGYDYNAYLRPNSLYGEVAGKGATLYTKLTDEIDASTFYRVSCNKPCKLQVTPAVSHYLEGIAEKTGWKKPVDGLIKTQVTVSEDGHNVTVKLFYNLSSIQQLIQKIENETGVMMPQYALTTVIAYDVSGKLENSSFAKTSIQTIAISITYGTGYTWERAGIIQVTGRDDSGLLVTMPTIKVVKNEAISTLRTILPLITPIMTAACIVAAIIIRDFEEQMKPKWLKLKSRLKAIDAERIPALEVVLLSSPKDLSRIAKDYDAKIFHVKNGDRHVFFATDGGLLYAYSCPDE